MYVFRRASREGGYLNSRISRHFMALEVLENRIHGNHNFLLTIRSRLIALCCRLVCYRLISPLCCNIDRPTRGSSETSIIVICRTVILITYIHLRFINSTKGLKTVSSFGDIRAYCLLATFTISVFASFLIHMDPSFACLWFTVTSPIFINVPTRGLLAVKTNDSFVLWLAKFIYQKNCL